MQIPQVIADELPGATLKSSWPLALIGLSFSGWTAQDWFYAISSFFVILQGAYVAWKWRREAKKPDESDRAGA